jgi:hypothetical protein
LRRAIQPVTVFCILASLIYAAASVFYLFYGRIFLDSGFYLNAATQVYQGHLPYRDFFFVQGPVYPYVYGAFLKGFGVSVLSGRLVSIFFGLVSFSSAVFMARRWGGNNGACWAAAFLAGSLHHAYYFSAIKLYALTGALLTAAAAILTGTRSGWLRYSLGASLAVLALGTRLTVLPGVCLMFLFIVIDGWKTDRRAVIGGIATGIMTGIILSVPFLLADREAVLYNLINIHVSAESGIYLFSMFEKMKVLVKLMVAYPLTGLGILGMLVFARKSWKTIRSNHGMVIMLSVILVITAAHLAANWFSVGYQSILMPLAAAVIGSILGTVITPDHRRVFIAIALIAVLVSNVLIASEPVWQGPGTVLNHVNNVGTFIRDQMPDNGTIAGCNGVFALHAGCANEPPFGGAPFTFTPGWDEVTCRRFGGINADMFNRMLADRVPAMVLLEPDSFSVGFPGFFKVDQDIQTSITNTLSNHYRKIDTFPNLGGGELTLNAYIPKAETHE